MKQPAINYEQLFQIFYFEFPYLLVSEIPPSVPFHTRPQPFAKNLCAKPFTLSPSVRFYSEVIHRGFGESCSFQVSRRSGPVNPSGPTSKVNGFKATFKLFQFRISLVQIYTPRSAPREQFN